MEDSEAKAAEIDILHPELLPKETIIKLLSDRNVKTLGLEHLERQKLLDLYYQHVIPHPQRKYRKNRRGQAMTKQQIIINKRKRSHSEMSGGSGDSGDNMRKSDAVSPSVNAPKSGLINSFSLPNNTERLKPPPSVVNFEKKVIKLGGSSGKITSQLDSLSIKPQPSTIKLTKSPSSATSSSNKANGSQQNSNGNQTHTVKITKILPQKLLDPKPGRKIQLKRPSAVQIANEPSQTETTEMDTQISKNDVTQQTPKETETKPEASTEVEEEEVPVKKFKRVSVQWP